jgi:23S rRNA G2069 N7-methylase RlmK/C1962 C5-methylase RlmI
MLADYVLKDFGKILKKRGLEMRRLMLQSDTDCMRVYDRNLEELAVTVDLYGPWARVTDYSEEGLEEDEIEASCDVVGRMLYVEAEKVIFHRREKRIGRTQHEVQDQESLLVDVKENGLHFTVDLTKRIDTGLFLDHMPTRLLVEQMSPRLKVLNLFSYTGSFSVYAARGGASLVESVDLSSTYSEWAQQNLAKNGFDGVPFPCISGDAREFIMQAMEAGKVYDLVIFDPPSFSNSRKMEHDFDVQRDHLYFMEMIHTILSKNGILLFSTNLQRFRMDVAVEKGYTVKEITKEVLAPGFSKRRASTRTWVLEKRDAFNYYPAQRKTGKSRQSEEYTMSKNKETKDEVLLVEEDQAIQEEATVVADDIVIVEEEQVLEEESAEMEDDDSAEDDDEQFPEEEANEIEDDLLTLNWEDESIEIATQEIPERRERPSRAYREDERRDRDRDRTPRSRDGRRSSHRDRDDRRPSYRDRDDRRPSYGDRDDRRPSFRDRDDRRPSYRDRDDRRPWEDRGDRRPSYRERDDRRPSFGDRDDRRPSFRDRVVRRPSYRDRDDRKPWEDRSDRRPSYGDRDDRRPSFRDRDDRRPSYRDRDDRKPWEDRGERRPSYGDRDDRRPAFRDRDDRRPSYRDRDDRRPWEDRGDRRPSFRDRDDRRPSYRDRDDRKPWEGRDDRRGGGRRDERPEFGEERPRRDREFSPKPYGYDRRSSKPRREREERRDPFLPREDE